MQAPVARDPVQLIDPEVEDRVLRAVLSHPKLYTLVHDQLLAEHFSTRVKSDAYRLALSHWQAFEFVPDLDIAILEARDLMGPNNRTLLEHYLRRLYNDIAVPEWAWIVKQIDAWIGKIRLQKACYEAVTAVEQGSVATAQAVLLKEVRFPGITRPASGNDLDLDRAEVRRIATERDLFCSRTHIYALDQMVGGLFYEELLIVMAALNVGKTWCLIHLLAAALLQAKGVLHISCEMNRERVLQRYFQHFAGLARPTLNGEASRHVEMWDPSFVRVTSSAIGTLADTDRVLSKLGIVRRYGGILSVRYYDQGTCKLGDIEREVHLFAAEHGKLPDVVAVDGALNLDLSSIGTRGMDYRHRVAHAASELRRMAGEHHLAMVLTHQGDRAAITAHTVGAEHSAEDLNIMRIADTGFSINQTRAEYELRKARLFVMRARNAEKWGMIELLQGIAYGQFCLLSRLQRREQQSPSPLRGLQPRSAVVAA